MKPADTVTIETRRVVFEGVAVRNAQELLWVRQVLNRLFGEQESMLHNHRPQNSGFFHRYPPIQFRAERDKAVLFGLGPEACSFIDELLERDDLPTEFLLSREYEGHTHKVTMLDHYERHYLRQWAGLNTENCRRWQTDLSVRERIEQLEAILVCNLFEFCKAIRFTVPDRSLQVRLLDYKEGPLMPYPKRTGAPMPVRTFELVYETNLSIPPHLGLGRGKSKGFGWQQPTITTSVSKARRLTLKPATVV